MPRRNRAPAQGKHPKGKAVALPVKCDDEIIVQVARVGDGETKGERSWEALLRAARNGSDAALGEMLMRCRSALEARGRRLLDQGLTPKVGDSLDMAQSTFAHAVEHFSSFHGDTKAEWESWLDVILRRVVANAHRRYRGAAKRDVAREIQITRDIAESLLPPEGPTQEGQWDHAVCQRIFDQLPAHYQSVIKLMVLDGRSSRQAAAILRRSDSAVRKLLKRAIACLRNRCSAQYQVWLILNKPDPRTADEVSE